MRDDRAIIQAISTGDEKALVELMGRYRDFLRRERRQRHSLSLSATRREEDEATPLSDRIASRELDAAQSTQGRELLSELQQAIRSLPEKLRFPFVFCVLEGNSQEEAAEIIKTSRKTVESRIYRARKQLQATLEGTR